MYRVVPFGLNISVAESIRALESVFGKELLRKLLVYVDDILVTGKCWEEHLNLLEVVCTKLRERCMSLKLEKCKFAVKELKFLGPSTTKHGITPDKDKRIN